MAWRPRRKGKEVTEKADSQTDEEISNSMGSFQPVAMENPKSPAKSIEVSSPKLTTVLPFLNHDIMLESICATKIVEIGESNGLGKEYSNQGIIDDRGNNGKKWIDLCKLSIEYIEPVTVDSWKICRMQILDQVWSSRQAPEKKPESSKPDSSVKETEQPTETVMEELDACLGLMQEVYSDQNIREILRPQFENREMLITAQKAMDDTQPQERSYLAALSAKVIVNKEDIREHPDHVLDTDKKPFQRIYKVAKLAAQCIARNPNQRPTIVQVVFVLPMVNNELKPFLLHQIQAANTTTMSTTMPPPAERLKKKLFGGGGDDIWDGCFFLKFR
ncbi:OLC1v1004971C1 [Oldenlandia corymbosa var. corymbosa]|uniref:OLC1v1004971C1 n=1 Tax=Oldenlandia corymbosa var. corymbosa TaxID=529605 RepID=A0AAV1DDL4_OLDCO|nr:OLC1v1004971C1 [Oldenlandia corymbosa var. corymbosa]